MPYPAVRTAVIWLRDTLFLVRHILPRPLRKRMGNIIIASLPSRMHMQTVLLPAIAAAGCTRMLFVGAQSYNLGFYRDCAALGITVWSLDFDPASALYGAPAGHFTGDIRRVDSLTGDLRFDVIIFNGILGFGINTAPDAIAALEAMAKIAAPGALLLVGWNPGLTDNQEIVEVRQRVKPAMLDSMQDIEFSKRGIQRHPHRYETFRF